MSGVAILEELRPRAFAVAYRMLGSVSEAEDIVQEALLRLHLALRQGEQIASPRAYLSTVVTRLCIDQLRSARVRRERYVGEWLPEPLVDDGRSDPAHHAEVADSLSMAFLVLLESLTPEQRAAFLLREVFDYPYAQIAAIIGTGEDNTRQLVSRARRHVDAGRPRFEASPQRREQLARSFLAAVYDGDLHALEELLAHDVVLHGDGGDRVRTIPRPVRGRAKVARLLLAGMRGAEAAGGWSIRQVQVNGQPGAMASDAAGRLVAVMVLDIADGLIHAVRSIVNPDKLRHLGRETS
ncbi:MAG TPA: RNA polymerase sigma-70 factor [Euzebyales bacterium]|nr:RNA polymerase sigma-70 factor [Euzebyales bacterium]